ncbi:MAG: dethiobiotin synthase [Methylotenera sp.]|nr:MAG: dethiobiotin synthase [Methylotenera sp.]
MKQAFFITGTDTGVGKTFIACKLIQQYVAQGYKVVGMKPVAAGCELVDGEWVNDDVLKLEAASNVKAPRALTNPYSFTEPIAPHIAAELTGKTIEISVIKDAFDALSQMADIVIVEGAGGFLVPLNNTEKLADLAQALNIPVVLVVGIKLGCINHAILTYEAVKARQIQMHAWIPNQIEPQMQYYANNIASIKANLSAINMIEMA